MKAYIKISIAYLLIAGIWIITSDSILSLFAQNQAELTNLQTYKGWFFVIVTSLLLFTMLRRWMNNLERAYLSEKQSRINLEAAELKLRKEDELNRVLIQQAADGIFVTDEKGMLTDVNTKACEILSVEKEKIIGRNLSEIFSTTSEDNKSATEHSQMSWKGERLIQGDGSSVKYIELNTAKLSDNRMMVIARDISVRRKTQQELKEMNDTLQGIVHASPAAIILLDRDGRVGQIWNKAAEEIFQWKREDVIGKFLPIVPQNKKEEFFTFFSKLVAGEALYGVEVVRQRKDGNPVHLNLSAAPLFNSSGNVHQIVAVVTDITDKVLAREEIQASEKKLRSLARYLQNVREQERAAIARELHDELGQILTSLKISLNFLSREIIQNKGKFDEENFKNEMNSMNEMINQSTMRLRKLISELRTDILDNLGLLSAIDYEVKQFSANSDIKCSFKSENFDDEVNKEKANTILRVMQESFTNIKKHSRAANVSASLIKNNGSILLTIKDDGEGFDTQILKSKETFGILGMKERAQSMDGKLTVESMPGNGTTVILELHGEA
ncbi:MAG: PAS domain S-box protein [Ignavibacteriales bacterium]|nr:MAG: PAS domain S-box protein [Ignavibacteriales bacterium]